MGAGASRIGPDPRLQETAAPKKGASPGVYPSSGRPDALVQNVSVRSWAGEFAGIPRTALPKHGLAGPLDAADSSPWGLPPCVSTTGHAYPPSTANAAPVRALGTEERAGRPRRHHRRSRFPLLQCQHPKRRRRLFRGRSARSRPSPRAAVAVRSGVVTPVARPGGSLGVRGEVLCL
jgi:hypothetical protein